MEYHSFAKHYTGRQRYSQKCGALGIFSRDLFIERRPCSLKASL